MAFFIQNRLVTKQNLRQQKGALPRDRADLVQPPCLRRKQASGGSLFCPDFLPTLGLVDEVYVLFPSGCGLWALAFDVQRQLFKFIKAFSLWRFVFPKLLFQL